MKPSPETYKARPHVTKPTRLNEIRNVIRMKLEATCPHYNGDIREFRDDIEECANIIVNELINTHLIGLPNEEGARTSVKCDLIAMLGAKCNCEKNEDADDVIRSALQVIG